MNVIYLTWGETPRSYGVYFSQIIKQIKMFSLDSKISFTLLSGVPVIHSGYFREKHKYFNEIKRINNELPDVDFNIIPIFTIQTTVNSSSKNFKYNHGFSHYLLYRKIKKINPDIVHCRSYHACWAANKVRDKYNLKYKVIFDARGLWPEEISLKKNDSTSSSEYYFRKKIENYNIKKSDVIVSVSDTMTSIFRSYGAKNVETIYISADTEVLKKAVTKKEKKIDDNVITFGYVGALSDDTWHKPEGLFQLYRKLRTLVKKPRLKIITTSSYSNLSKYITEFPDGEVVLKSTYNIKELTDEMESIDIGLMSYFNPKTESEKKLASTVLAVKSVEYLSAGVPIIVNKYCGGISEIVNKNGFGFSYNSNDIDNITSQDIQKIIRLELKSKMALFSMTNFSYISNKNKYFNLYYRIISDI